MPENHRVVSCRAERDYRLWLRFEDGLVGAVYLGNLLELGAFAVWRDVRRFVEARPDPETGCVMWPAGRVRLDPDTDVAARYVNYLNETRGDEAWQRFRRAALTQPKRRCRGG
jgi:hypothetical protein